jgi:hypothetical protein
MHACMSVGFLYSVYSHRFSDLYLNKETESKQTQNRDICTDINIYSSLLYIEILQFYTHTHTLYIDRHTHTHTHTFILHALRLASYIQSACIYMSAVSQYQLLQGSCRGSIHTYTHILHLLLYMEHHLHVRCLQISAPPH